MQGGDSCCCAGSRRVVRLVRLVCAIRGLVCLCGFVWWTITLMMAAGVDMRLGKGLVRGGVAVGFASWWPCVWLLARLESMAITLYNVHYGEAIRLSVHAHSSSQSPAD